MLKVNNLVGFGAGGVAGVLEYSNHTYTGASNTDPTIPTGLISGDLLIAMATRNAVSTISNPSGWTAVASDTDTSGAVSIVTKVSDGTETGQLSLFTSEADRGVILALTGGLTSLGSIVDPDAQAYVLNPSAQVKNASTLGVQPFVVVGYYSSEISVDPRIFTGDTPDGEKGSTEAWTKWLFYGSGAAPADITIDMGDEGSTNGLASAIIEVNF